MSVTRPERTPAAVGPDTVRVPPGRPRAEPARRATHGPDMYASYAAGAVKPGATG